MDNQNQMDEILVYLDIERLRTKVIPGRDPVRYPPYVRYMTPFERHRFTMKCIYCHQTSAISDTILRDKLNSIDMFQKLNARLLNHFPYHRYPPVTCPKCKRVILFPHWMQLIDRVRYVPTLAEGALEIGRMDMQNNYKDWEADGDQPITEDDFYWIADIALNEAYPCCWFPYTNKYLRELKMDKKIILGKNTGDASGRSIDLSYRDVATLHHSFIGLMERMWKALKNRDKAPFKDMDLPAIDLTNFKMKMLEMESIDNNGDITVVRFYVRNVFDDSNRKWFAFRDMTLRTFLPYDGDVKTGRYDFDSMWGWFSKIKTQDTKYEQLYETAQYLTWYLNNCVTDFLNNDIRTS